MSGFKVNARTIFHLGADLISSDAVALYELVKNAFDAKSESVAIEVFQRVPIAIANPLIEAIAADLQDADIAEDEATFENWRDKTIASVARDQDNAFRQLLVDADDLSELFECYSRVNEVVVNDTGDGMSLSDLQDIFLTIGTMSRKSEVDKQRQSNKSVERIILGEKGVGRLSTMRLGRRLRVETATINDTKQNLLEIDWTLFDREPDVSLESIEFAPIVGEKKPVPKGTSIRILQLNSDWSVEKLHQIAVEQFSRLSDPFSAAESYPIDLYFNAKPVIIPAFRKALLDSAHAVVRVDFGPENPDDLLENGKIKSGASLKLRGSVNYRFRNRTCPIDVSGVHLRSISGATDETLRSLGAFNLEVYWFNRQILERVDTIGEAKAVRDLVNGWSGGVMVYRDGFRVGAYGQGADDWLDLDRKALASGGYKVNRAQLIGRLLISAVANPQLIDQTNREGLRDSPEKHALVLMLKHVLESVFRAFLDGVEREIQAREPVDLANVADRVLKQRRTIAATLKLLYQRYPQIKTDPEIGGRIDEALKSIGEMMRSLEDLGASYEKARTEMTVLAGVGLSVASIAHELRQATSNALEMVDSLRRRRASTDISSALAPLGAQLKTLLTRLRVLDPMVTSGRQVKTKTDIVELSSNTVQSAMPVFERDGIKLQYKVLRRSGAETFEERVVQGMVVQVIGNLLDNARYWVGRARLEDPRLEGLVLVEVDVGKREIRVSDNGPGVEPSMRDTIFQAFVTTKPVGAGLGLGLFISREIAGYSGAALRLVDDAQSAPGMSTTFALKFGGTAT